MLLEAGSGSEFCWLESWKAEKKINEVKHVKNLAELRRNEPGKNIYIQFLRLKYTAHSLKLV